MKKIILTLAALTALTGAALANNRAEDGTAASRNVNANANVGTVITQSAGASAFTTTNSDSSDFLMIKRYGIEPSSDNN